MMGISSQSPNNWPGVFFQILRVVKLCRVNKDATNYLVGLTAGDLKQRQVSLVQSTHRRHKTDGFALVTQSCQVFAKTMLTGKYFQ